MFPISMITGDPLWNSLPAAKIINYPLEKADYKPYAQARLCISNDDFYIQLLAFEVEPEEKSVVGAAIAPFSEEDGGKRYFWFSTNRSGALVCKFIDETTGNETDVSKNVSVRIFTGEDEQGVGGGATGRAQHDGTARGGRAGFEGRVFAGYERAFGSAGPAHL